MNTFSQHIKLRSNPLMAVGHFNNTSFYLRRLNLLPRPFTEQLLGRVAVRLISAINSDRGTRDKWLVLNLLVFVRLDPVINARAVASAESIPSG